ncbi:ABC transporter ATP-binding protein [Limobrevibacterium gyesilva]|uniref:Spermidine/putrescine import ATP-binding protein PotA n=1 Tax=Limobrevibacterium gyesilva TaxID=2991712 RepID=A0AA42CDC2_9PROT|nr:ABC transporter ATP-binding protein [Limobrevibacterium gyesilva]MCW3474678.1 ABC transporter ATP-binding protein [Limobrevibacterium gyesilva]
MKQAADGGISLDQMTKRYGAETVVDGVSITIAPGEFFTLLGPSGSGKTTTLSMIAGFVEPDGGRILFGGRDVTRTPSRLRGLGMVFQNYAIFPHLNVFENVAFPLRVRRSPKAEITQRVGEVMEMVKLQGFERRFGRELSGGQQQRVALARAIVAHPPIILMDEPLGALDKNLRYHMQVEIKEIQQRLGLTVVYVTHDQEEALTMSDRIAIMQGGRIAQMGPPRQVYEQPDSTFVGRFLGEANLIAARRQGADTISKAGSSLRAAQGALGLNGSGWMFVRPEKISLTDAGGAPGQRVNMLTGTIRHASFLGNVVRYVVDAGADGPVVCDAANAASSALRPAGERVALQWRPEDCRLLAQ